MCKFILTLAITALWPLTSWATPLTFSYDALGRMTAFTLPAGNQVDYTYDANGNRMLEDITLQSAFDPDGDLIPNITDNCPSKTNIAQTDADNDGKGDVCDYLNWAQLITGYYYNYGNQDGITIEQLMANHGMTDTSQIGSLSNYSDKIATNREVTGVAFDPNSNRIYFSETWASIIRHVDLATQQVVRNAGAGSIWHRGLQDGIGTSAKMNMPEQIAASPDGQWIYIPDYANCVIRRMNTATNAVTTYAGEPSPCEVPYANPSALTYQDGAASTARFYWPRGLAVDTDGTVYVGDSGNRAVRKISTGGIVTTLVGGPSNTIGMTRPDGVVIFGDNLYVADRLSRVIWKINKTTGNASVVIGKLHSQNMLVNVPGNQANLSCPLAVTGSGNNLFISDDCANALYQVDINNGYFITLLNTQRDHGFTDGPLGSAKFSYVQGISYDAVNNLLYVGDFANRALRRINLTAKTVSTILGLNTVANTYQDGDGLVARFSQPSGIANIDDSTLLVADTRNCLIRKITLDAQFGAIVNGKFNSTVSVSTFSGQLDICKTWTFLGVGNPDNGPVDVSDAPNGAAAKFYQPTKIAIDGNKQFAYVSSKDGVIRRLDLATGGTHTLAGKALASIPMDGIGANAQFRSMGGLAYVDEPQQSGDTLPALYVTEKTYIRRISLSPGDYGTVTTPYGHFDESGTQDGNGTSARFKSIGSIEYLKYKGTPYLFVAHAAGHTIRQINLLTKEVKTIAGTGVAGSADGVGTEASFDCPASLAVATFPGNIAYLYVGDVCTPKLRVIDLETMAVSTVSGSGLMGIKDGIGGAADWSAPANMTYIPSKNRLFIVDTASRAIRQLTPDPPK